MAASKRKGGSRGRGTRKASAAPGLPADWLNIQDEFLPRAEALKLRHEFARRYADPRQAGPERFQWDWWHVPGQYTLLRAPAQVFFPRPLVEKLQQRLLEKARADYGCTAITPPWVSLYVDGCFQEWHADVPHGPWAYVYSLTDWKDRPFTGGETLLLNPEVLNWWSGFSELKGVERDEITLRVPAEFNRLTVFDPRIPHGVSRVAGVQDPLRARIVVHGWFAEPRPHFEGGIDGLRAGALVNAFMDRQLPELTEALPPMHGTLVLRFHADARGRIRRVERLCSSLVPRGGRPEEWESVALWQDAFPLHAAEALGALPMGRAARAGSLTVPFLFR